MASNHRTTGPFRPVVVGALLLGGAVCVVAALAWAGPPPPSPGIQIGTTMWDVQSTGSPGYQIGRNARADIVHFCWMKTTMVNQFNSDRYVAYNSYSVSGDSLLQGESGVLLTTLLARAGYGNLAVDQNNAAHVVLHQRSDAGPYASWHLWFPTAGNAAFLDEELPTTPVIGEALWPRIALQQNPGGTDIVHVIAHGDNLDPQDRIVYWRYDGSVWQGPVAIDSHPAISYAIAADPNSDRAAIIMSTDREPQYLGANNIAYYESMTEGAGWVSGAELGDGNKQFVTAYTDVTGPQPYLHISAAYDNSSVLHVIWDEVIPTESVNVDAAIRHWNGARATVRTVLVADWPAPFRTGPYNLKVAKMTLGIGDGSTMCQGGAETNRDYLYIVYTQFSGPTAEEQADHSFYGDYNGELYLSVSRDAGTTWSRPQNLTNTKSPGCDPGPPFVPYSRCDLLRPDSVCRSEHWATIGKDVYDIDIFYISDLDAERQLGGSYKWTCNPVMYLRLPGGTTDAPYLCPPLDAQMAVSLSLTGPCGFHADSGWADTAMFTIGNSGNATLSGTAMVEYFAPDPLPAPWLYINGDPTYDFSITPGGADETLVLTMVPPTGFDSGGLGAYVRVTHNDTTQPSPRDILVEFAVAPCLCHGDPQCDGVPDVLDVTAVVNEAFRGTPPVTNSLCPHVSPSDLNCDCVVDVRDVVGLVGFAFRNEPVLICDPCAQPCP